MLADLVPWPSTLAADDDPLGTEDGRATYLGVVQSPQTSLNEWVRGDEHVEILCNTYWVAFDLGCR
jgi:hypothetical protein